MKTRTDNAPQVRAFYSAAASLQREIEVRLPRRVTPPSDPPIADDLTPDSDRPVVSDARIG